MNRLLLVGPVIWILVPHALSAQQVFFGNLHSHTSFSDGSGLPEEAYAHARNVGLDFLAITEHNHPGAENSLSSNNPRRDGLLIGTNHALYVGPRQDALILAANRANSAGAFVAIYGQEFSSISKGNHSNVFFVDAVIDVRSGCYGPMGNGCEDGDLVTFLGANRDFTGQLPLVQFNHPELENDSHEEYGADDFGDRATWISTMDSIASLIEIANGPSTGTGTERDPASISEADYREYLNIGFHLAPTADQDNHFETWGSITEARTGVVANELSRASVLAALKGRRVYATLDRNLRLIARVNGHLMGDIVETGFPVVGEMLRIEIAVTDDDEPDAEYSVQVFSDDRAGGDESQEIDRFSFDGNRTAGQPFIVNEIPFTGAGQYLFLRIRQTNEHGGPDLAWTAPVWFEAPSSDPPPVEADVRIVSLLPNPAGDERRDERASLRNTGLEPVDMQGWRLRDRAGREWSLDSLGTMAAGAEETVFRNGQSMAMNNSGTETISLVDPHGSVVHSLSYDGAAEGQVIQD